MIVPGEIDQYYNYINPYVNQVSKYVTDILMPFSDQYQFPFLKRIKSKESFTEKIETGRFKKITDIEDLLACTLIIPTLADEEVVLKFLESEFNKVKVKERGKAQKHPSIFRFDSTRFIGILKPPLISPESILSKINFEVQIRTAFEHAWISATYSYSYKGSSIDWKKERLTAQLKANVESMDSIIIEFDNYSSHIDEHYWPEIRAKKIIETHFRELFKTGTIPDIIEPNNWSRFCNNCYSLLNLSNQMDSTTYLREEIFPLINHEIGDNSPFPLSISLIQFIFGALIKHDYQERLDLTKYTPLITRDLCTIFPCIIPITTKFDFET